MTELAMEIGTCVEKYGEKQTEEELHEIIRRTYGMALLYGVQKSLPTKPEQMDPMPFTLYPSIMPKRVLQKAFELQKPFQRLICDVSKDHEFLKYCLEKIIPVDDFTRKLWEIYEIVRNEIGSYTKDVSFMLTRNDYMMEKNGNNNSEIGIKQVEFNTFASGAGGVISGVREIHRYSMALSGIQFKDEKLPFNCPVKGMAEGFVQAWRLYNNPKAAVLFVVGYPEANTPDQRWLEREIFNLDRNVRVYYKTFEQIMQTLKLGPNKELIIDKQEIAVVYFRYGYSPKHYPTEKEFDLRLQIERSKAIKCPSVALHLAGCKKVQQELCNPEVLQRYVQDTSTQTELRKTFMGQISLDKMSDNVDFVKRALSNPEHFVLKPQREGGGNNLFGEDVKQFLQSTNNTEDNCSWILMERIQALEHTNRLIRSGLGPESRTVTSELGIFGAYLREGDTELCNMESGFLLRTKPVTANEGGLFHGQSCLDSPYLI